MIDEAKSRKEGKIGDPVDATSAEFVEKDDDGRQPEQTTKRRRISLWAMSALIILAALVIGSYLIWPIVSTLILDQLQTNSTHTTAAIKKLNNRITLLEAAKHRYERAISSVKDTQDSFSKRLDNLTKALPNNETLIILRQNFAAMEATIANLDQNSSSISFKKLEQELESLKARYTELVNLPNPINYAKTAKKNSALAAENSQVLDTLSTLQTRLTVLEKSLKHDVLARKNTGLEQSLILAVGQLRETVQSGRPYAEPLDAVVALSKKNTNLDEAISILTPHKKQGIITLRALADQFPSVARAAIMAENADGGEFLQRTWQRVSSLVTIRRVGEIDGAETDAILARAERRLIGGELVAAINVIENLKGPANAAVQDWLNLANNHLNAEVALAEMQRHAIDSLADN